MKKKLLSLLLILCMLSGFAVLPASCMQAGGEETQKYVYDLPFDLSKLLSFFFGRLQNGGEKTQTRDEKTNDASAQTSDSIPSEAPTQSQSGTQTVKDDGKQTQNNSVAAYEKEVVRLVNIERWKYGLKALTYSSVLSDGAREKSADMQRNKYFSHTSPTYGSPFDRMKARGITYRSAGENIAMGYRTPEAVVNAWMNSPGHRANILSEKFTEIGVGYVASGNYWTQWFRG